MMGRNPERWRLDALGNPVFKFLKGCQGPFCHEYDHIIPFSKGGKTVLENCQLLQTRVNLIKSNKTEISYEELKKASPNIRFTGNEIHVHIHHR
jgi:5-methylcytosine-specific restriction endonuclease McrA